MNHVSHTPRRRLSMTLFTTVAMLLCLASPARAAVPDPALPEAQVAHERADTRAGEHAAQTEPAKARYARAGARLGAALTGIPTLVGVVWAWGSILSEMHRISNNPMDKGDAISLSALSVLAIYTPVYGFVFANLVAAAGGGLGAAVGYGIGATVDALEE